MFHSFFESSLFRTIRNYTIFLSFLNVPHLISGLISEEKITLSAIVRGSSFMFSVQVNFFKWLMEQAGSLLGEADLYSNFVKMLSQSLSPESVRGLILLLGILFTLVLVFVCVKIFGRFVPVLANLNAHHRPNPWSMLYLLLFVGYIFISLTN